MKKYEVTLKCICVEVAEDGTKSEILRDGPTWTVPYAGMVAIQQLLLGVINKVSSWGLSRLSKEESAGIDGMIK